MSIDKQTATRRLKNRWLEQVELFPTMRDEIPLKPYISQNVRHVMVHDLLQDYNNTN